MKALPQSLMLAVALSVLAGAPASAQQLVLVTVPAAVSFSVPDVSQDSIGTPISTVSFTILNLTLFHVVQASVKADSDFVPPSGSAIAAAKLSWTINSASGAVGSPGTMSTASYGVVFQSSPGLTGSGNVAVRWKLTAPGTSIRAGNHSVVIRWKFESVVP